MQGWLGGAYYYVTLSSQHLFNTTILYYCTPLYITIFYPISNIFFSQAVFSSEVDKKGISERADKPRE